MAVFSLVVAVSQQQDFILSAVDLLFKEKKCNHGLALEDCKSLPCITVTRLSCQGVMCGATLLNSPPGHSRLVQPTEKARTERDKEGKSLRAFREREMVSREQKGGVLHEKLQILRSVTHSHAVIFIFVLLDE